MTGFTLTDDQQKQARQWVDSHTCSIDYSGAIGGKTTYSFTSTSIGVVEKVSCACGEELDLTDYDMWQENYE